MKSKQQTGSIHLIIIIVLVVALLGALGFIYWRHKPTAPATTTKTTASTSSNLATLNIPELGVGLLYDNSLPAVGYTFQKAANGVAASADITSKSLVGTTCVGDTGSIAQIVQNPTSTSNFSDSPIVATVTINSTKYVLTLSGTNCASNPSLLSQYQSSIEHNFIQLKTD